jgi:hypothetical protein
VIRKFGRVFGHAVTVIPGIPVFLDGRDDTAVARNLVEMGLWLSKISESKTHTFSQKVWDSGGYRQQREPTHSGG